MKKNKKFDFPFWVILFLGITLIIFAWRISYLENRLREMKEVYNTSNSLLMELFIDYKDIKNRRDWLKKRVEIQDMELKGIRLR